MSKLRDAVDPKLVSDLVDEIVRELKAERSGEKPTSLPRGNLESLRSQLEELKRELELSEVESHREVAERFGGLNEDLERHIVDMESEINTLKAAMVKLSTELKRIRDSK